MRLLALPILLLVAACTTTSTPVPAPVVDVQGPKFTPGQFHCGDRPRPPDPDRNGTGRAGATYENNLGAYADGCAAALQSVGAALAGAGQIAGTE